LGPRLYLAPRADGRHWLGWTDRAGNAHVSLVGSTGVDATFEYASEEVRGLVAHDDGGFAVLLRTPASGAMRLTRRTAANAPVFSTTIPNSTAIAQMNTGDGRLAFGNNRYAAYFAVHGTAGGFAGHEGDQLAYLDASGNLAGGWEWGCSHQMAGLVGFHPGLNWMTTMCVSDCYSKKGILVNNARSLFTADASCDGTVWAQFGQLAPGAATWKLAFAAQDRATVDAKGIGLLTFDNAGTTPVLKWLTDTDGSTERDPVIARIGSGTPERFLVGWRQTGPARYRLGVIDGGGTFVVASEEVQALGVAWNARDDSLRATPSGDVAWVGGAAGATTVKLYTYSESAATDAVFGSGFEP
ncbi:MAG TPA: hypothetical protein VJ724_00180, partial [Tahibacter sp.]|nr:hypothetical protein [Tahibacter sp.]